MKRLWITLISILALTGCAGYSPSSKLIGKDRWFLISEMGTPEREYWSSDLQVLHYPRGPGGSHTYFVYLDKNDVVVKWDQVLTEAQFDKIRAGMPEHEVINLLGITKMTHQIARDRGYVWHYRYQTFACKSFVIEFTSENTVRSAGYLTRTGRKCKYVGIG